MVGKPNLPNDPEKLSKSCGAAVTTPGLDALDQEREASMADEGGAAGAVMESQNNDENPELRKALSRLYPTPQELDKNQSDLTRSAKIGFAVGLTLGIVSALAFHSIKKKAS